jgi:hypothetical protein
MTFARSARNKLRRIRSARAPCARFEFPGRRCCSASPVEPPGRRHKPGTHQSAFMYASTLLIFRLSRLLKLPPPQPSSARGCAGQRPDSAKHEHTTHAGLYVPSNMICWVEQPPSENLASNARCCAAKRRASLSSETPSCGRCRGAARLIQNCQSRLQPKAASFMSQRQQSQSSCVSAADNRIICKQSARGSRCSFQVFSGFSPPGARTICSSCFLQAEAKREVMVPVAELDKTN